MNITKQIADLLGVEMEEVFSVSDNPTAEYCIKENGLMQKCNGEWKRNRYVLQSLICGEMTIVKQKFKPNLCDTYYYVNLNSMCIENTTWQCDSLDIYNYFNNNCYKTFEDCLAGDRKMVHEVRDSVL